MNKKILSVLVIVVALIGVFLRVSRIYRKNEKKQQNLQYVNAQPYTTNNTKEIQNQTKEVINNIQKQTSEELPKFEKYTPVNGEYSLGLANGKHYIVDVKTKESFLLENVEKAYVLYIKNVDSNAEMNAIFTYDRTWTLRDKNGKVIADLGNIDINEKSKFEIKDNQINVTK